MSAIAAALMQCEESTQSEIPTPLEFAFEMLGVNHRDRQEALVAVVNSETGLTHFSEGWDAGVECNLDIAQMPADLKEPEETRAWLVGFVAGQYAGSNDYPTPFCVIGDHQH